MRNRGSVCIAQTCIAQTCIAQDAAADELLGRGPLAPMTGLLLDQCVRGRSSRRT